MGNLAVTFFIYKKFKVISSFQIFFARHLMKGKLKKDNTLTQIIKCYITQWQYRIQDFSFVYRSTSSSIIYKVWIFKFCFEIAFLKPRITWATLLSGTCLWSLHITHFKKVRACGAVGSAFASHVKGLRFKSGLVHFFFWASTIPSEFSYFLTSNLAHCIDFVASVTCKYSHPANHEKYSCQ